MWLLEPVRSVAWCTLVAVAGRLSAVALCKGGPNQRICFSGIGSLSHHVVSGPSSQILNGSVAELFIPFLQQEGNSCGTGSMLLKPILDHDFSVSLLKAF